MCGIGGIVRFDGGPVAPVRAAAMLERLQHRGPDGEGTVALAHCTLVHARLAIIDPAGGSQPMQAPASAQHGPLHLVYNGEIYNHRELRRQLEQHGHPFRSDHSDTEVLLLGYRQWGLDLPRRLEGMFAFALWDERERTLVLVRDRAGKKPLYYARRGDELVFASTVAALVAGLERSVALRVDRQALRTYLRFGYTDTASLVEGAREVPPAHLLTFTPSSERCHRYWQFEGDGRESDSAAGTLRTSPDDAVHAALDRAVRDRLEADVPLGCFLSGGIDSSLVAALAGAALREQGRPPLQTFSVRMPVADYDESPAAAAVAEHLGTQHRTLDASPRRDVLADLEHLISTSGEPTGDSSILPTYWLSVATRQHVKAALSGDGGDEVFGGYDRYRALALLQQHRWWLSALPAPRPTYGGASQRTLRSKFSRLRRAAQLREPAAQYGAMVELFNPEQLDALGLPADPTADVHALPDWPQAADRVAAAMRWDFEHYLPFDLLRKVDRAAMAVALEVRCPMLDSRLCRLVASLSTQALLPGGRPKGLLRRIASRYLPESIVRRRKQGFALPIGEWFRTTLRDPLCAHLGPDRLALLGLNPEPVAHWLDDHLHSRADHTHRLFTLLTLSMWRERAGVIDD